MMSVRRDRELEPGGIDGEEGSQTNLVIEHARTLSQVTLTWEKNSRLYLCGHRVNTRVTQRDSDSP